MITVRNLKACAIEGAFFRPRWYSIFINPYFIARSSLYRAVRDYAQGTTHTTRVLDIGCGVKPYRSLFVTSSYVGIDIEGGGHTDTAKIADAYYDGAHIPFPNASFDAVLCTQVLEHADNPEEVISEAARVLVPGGMAFFSMPFVYPEHEIPYDFRRFTRFEHERRMKAAGFTSIAIHPTTGFFGTCGQIFIVMCFEGIRIRASFLKALLTFFIFAPIQIVSLLLDALFRKPGVTLDYVIIASKP